MSILIGLVLQEKILFENGSYFTLTEFKEFSSKLQIEHRKSTIYMPFSNGLLERVHRIIKVNMASISNNVIKLSEKILNIKLHYNSCIHKDTQFSYAAIFFR